MAQQPVPSPSVRTRTREEMQERNADARTAAPAQPKVPLLADVIASPVRVKELEAAADALYHADPALGFIRLALADAGMKPPTQTNLFEFVLELMRNGWGREITCLAQP